MAQSEDARSSLAARAERWTYELVAMPSVTGTPDEAAFAERLRARLAGLPLFAGRPQDVWTIPVAGDRLGRASVAALVRGEGVRTIVLTGHFDTVHVEDYGALAGLALQPHALREAMIKGLRAGADPAERLALADLESGDFLPGRGLLDMKSGLAAALAVLEAYAERPRRAGNLLFLVVPDEEANSAGARSAAVALKDIARKRGLAIEGAINLDSLVEGGDGRFGRSVALGTVGKLLPSALIVGQAVHASNATSGLNAGALAAGIVSAVEWSDRLADRRGDELAAPATLLGIKDNRTAYDVTTPERIWAYWNVMLLRRGAGAVLSAFADICRSAAARTLSGLGARLAALGATGRLPDSVPVLTFAELRAEVLDGDPAAAGTFAKLARDAAARGLDLPEQCRILTEHLWSASRRPGPAVVVGFASLPYLPTELAGAGGARLERAVRAASAGIAQRHDASIGVIRSFPGISDMSHFGQADAAAIPLIAANTPAWGFGIEWPRGAGPAGIPIVNAGPWGRDYHTPLERAHAAYAFAVLPDLLLGIVDDFFSPRATGN